MTDSAKERIAFDVETSRILQILSSEIYDSPKAFLRENVQNAYDAILMRCTAQELPIADRRIEITVEANRLIVRDDGIGMSEDVLKNNFWKAGSSGKRSELAQRSGVIGTFGIGAMANFGVCTALRVETRHIGSDFTLISSAQRDELKIAQDCIDLERLNDEREPGTLIVADLDPAFPIDAATASQYLQQYVRFVPVPVVVNGEVISQQGFQDTISGQAVGYNEISSRQVSRGEFAGTIHISIGPQSRLLARLTEISLNGTPIRGEAFFLQQGGPTHGFRNLFGLAPIPVSGQYGLGGFVNLDILHPTAGREALSRDSIQHVSKLVEMVEAEASADIANTDAADTNQHFQNYILAHNLTPLAHRLTVTVLPGDVAVPLGDIGDYEPNKPKHYYHGRDATIINRFASEKANLLNISQSNPRRKLQLKYLAEVARMQQVPDQTIVERISATDLTFEEAMFLVRLRSVLLDDYLMPEVDAAFATISHGVSFHVDKHGDGLQLSIARGLPTASMVIETYTTARDVFDGFLKDFVREHLYPHIKDHVPSSTKQGRDALYKRLKENKELFRLQESDYAPIESLLSDFMSGEADFSEVLQTSRSRVRAQHQQVSRAQVGSVESELPGIIDPNPPAPSEAPEPLQEVNELEAVPPLMRDDVETDMKVLTVDGAYPKLNNFQMFLALSDRMVQTEGDFLHWPHTTKVIWGAHRVIYIFTDATGELSLYYDIELKTPLDIEHTGGAMFPTTTIVTKKRIFVPVPKDLESAFQITDGEKKFYVRFDTIP